MDDPVPAWQEALRELFVAPFVKTISDYFGKKTLVNRAKVIALCHATNMRKLDHKIIRLIDIRLNLKKKDHPIRNALESLWRTYSDMTLITNIYKDGIGNIGPNYYKRIVTRIVHEVVEEEYSKLEKDTVSTIEINMLIRMLFTLFSKSRSDCNSTIGRFIDELSLAIVKNRAELLGSYKMNFSGNDFSNMDLSSTGYYGVCCANCDFSGTTFYGDGSTHSCLHWDVREANFTGARFLGKICTKTSDYTGANFTEANITGLIYNFSETKFHNCDFTNAYVEINDKKLMGKELIRYLKDQRVDITGYHYSAPDDGGYDEDAMDTAMWSESDNEDNFAEKRMDIMRMLLKEEDKDKMKKIFEILKS